MKTHPPIAELVPHAGAMRLLSHVLEHSPRHTLCAVDPAGSGLFRDPDGSLPAWLGLEYLAQCAAVHGSLVTRARGQAPPPALLLGSRRLEIRAERFEVGQWLHVSVRHNRGDTGLVIFDGEVCDAAGGDVLVAGRINVYPIAPEAAGDLARGGGDG